MYLRNISGDFFCKVRFCFLIVFLHISRSHIFFLFLFKLSQPFLKYLFLSLSPSTLFAFCSDASPLLTSPWLSPCLCLCLCLILGWFISRLSRYHLQIQHQIRLARRTSSFPPIHHRRHNLGETGLSNTLCFDLALVPIIFFLAGWMAGLPPLIGAFIFPPLMGEEQPSQINK